MENASKALIIAGAILLAILIISLGILIYNQAAGVVNNNAMSEVEAQNFNQKFTQYEGNSVRGSTVRALYQAVLSNNNSQDSDDRKVEIATTGFTGTTNIPKALAKNVKTLPDMSGVNTGSSYSVTCNYSDKGANKGLVNKITIGPAK